jgi:hypothetical protein
MYKKEVHRFIQEDENGLLEVEPAYYSISLTIIEDKTQLSFALDKREAKNLYELLGKMIGELK